MAVYSVLLAKGHAATGLTQVYAAPVDGVVVVRDVVLIVTGTPPSYMGLYSLDPGGALGYIMSQANPVQLQSYHWSGRQVLVPNEQLWITPGGPTIRYRISGYLLGV